MRRATPRAQLALLIHRSLIPAGHIIRCTGCGAYFDPSDIQASYPHNNH